MSKSLKDSCELKAYAEDVELFIEALKGEPSALHSKDLAGFTNYLKSLGAKIPACGKCSDHLSSAT
jgi:hypothetical protein